MAAFCGRARAGLDPPWRARAVNENTARADIEAFIYSVWDPPPGAVKRP